MGAQPNLWLLGDAAPVQLPDAYQWPADLSAVGEHFFSHRHGFPHFGMIDRHGRLILQVQTEEPISSLSITGDILAFVAEGKVVVLRVDGMVA